MYYLILEKNKLRNIIPPEIISDDNELIKTVNLSPKELCDFIESNTLFEHKNKIWYLNSLECIGTKHLN